MLLLETGEGLVDFVERPHLVERQTHDARLLGQSLENRLANPPHGIRDELEAARFIELLGRLDKSEVALVNQVRQAEALILVLFGDRHDEAQIGLRQLLERLLVSLLDSLGEFHLFLDRDELLLANLLKILVQ